MSARASSLLSLRFPVPNPITDRNTPLFFSSSMSRVSSPSLVTPTFRSPSVARMMRLLPSFRKCFSASW